MTGAAGPWPPTPPSPILGPMASSLEDLRAALAGRYEIDKEIGQGGMAAVYLAEDLKHHRKVAVKVLRPELAAVLGPERFLREIETTANLNHPHILPLFDSGEADGFLFYVMPHVEGQSLRERLNRDKQIPVDEAVRIAAQIADALHSAHRHGIVHRDIKPENVLFQEGHAVVADFGVARALDAAGGDRLTETGLAVGTPAYMSPEQASGETDLDGRVDVYALGCVLYEMLAGEPPYTGPTAHAIVAKHLADPVPAVRRLRDTVPDSVDSAISKALAKSRVDRFRTPEEFTAALAAPPMEARRWLLAPVPAATLVAVALVIALNVGGVRDIMIRPFTGLSSSENAVGGISVAVLPMQNITGNAEDEYFAAGMTEEIIVKLGHIGDFRVPARTSVLQFRDQQQDVRDIARKLGVLYVLESSMRKEGNRFRITARLIEASTGLDQWSRDFGGQLEDVFAVQDTVALQIAQALGVHLSPAEESALRRRYTEKADAYDAYLRGWALVESTHGSSERVKEKLEAARGRFEDALDLDSGYPLALAGLAMAEASYYSYVEQDPVYLERAEDLAGRALAIDSEIAEAYGALALVHGLEGDFSRAIEQFRRALRLDDDNAYYWCDLAWACNSKDPPVPADAEEAAREAVRLHQGYFWSHYQLGWALEHQGRYSEAAESYEYAAQLNATFRDTYLRLARAYVALQGYDQALKNYEKARKMRETPSLVATIGAIHAALGNTEKSLAELERALEAGYRDVAAIEGSPHFDGLRDDPRFQDLLRRMNLPGRNDE